MTKLLLYLCAVTTLASGLQQVITFNVTRPFRSPNLLTFLCKNSTNQPVVNPLFFRNNIRAKHVQHWWTDYQGNSIHYEISQMREGEFTCGDLDDVGNLTVSNALILVGE